jgi:DNA segregation ATPase FtsK/SpoIIIE, S-DNA-T family
MATKRRAKPKPPPGPDLAQFMRGEIVGSALVLLAIIMLLSLLSTNRGQVTGAIIGLLQTLFGAGTWLVPVLLAALGVWVALRDVSDPHALSAWRVVGILAFFVAFEGFAHLIAGLPDPALPGQDGKGGGAVGWVFSQGLILALGFPAAVATLLVIAGIALLGIAGLSLADVQQKLTAAWHSLRNPAGEPGAPSGVRVNPPLFEEHELFWARWLRLFREGRGMSKAPVLPPPPSVTGTGWPNKTPAPAPARGAATAAAAGAAVATRGGQPAAPAGATPAALPQPRIIGGTGQTWHVPVMSEVLEDYTEQDIKQEDLRKRIEVIENTLAGFGVPVQVVEVNQGPAVTQFGLRPGTIVRKDRKGEEKQIKVRVSQIQALSNDLSLALAASPIRIEAPVPGRDFVGVEVPNMQISNVSLRGVLESEEYAATKGKLLFGLGRDVSGQAVVADLTRMPHLLIAGATGSGKSVCVNSIITSLLLNHTPDTLRFLMVDPKRVELTLYNGIPHLIAPVVVDVERAVPVLQWATKEMERRYKLFAKAGARNIESYNEKQAAKNEPGLPFIVILIDELADLMLSAPEDVERYICRIAQMARATGMHLVLATQRPSVDVVTGLIKANFPARIAFAVTSQIDSRVILDTPGAEQLLGRGDMLFMAPDSSKLQRLQGCWVSERETLRLVSYWRGARTFVEPEPMASAAEGEENPVPGAAQAEVTAWGAGEADAGGMEPPYLPGQETLQQPLWKDVASSEGAAADRDDMYWQAVEEVRRSGKASISLLQRRLRIGYSRAARLIDQMEADGVVGPELGGTRGREVLPEPSKPNPATRSAG